MKNSTIRKWKKGFAVRAAALTFLITILITYSTGVYLFSDFIFVNASYAPATPSTAFLSQSEDIPPMLPRQTHTESLDATKSSDADPYGYTFIEKTSLADLDTAAQTLDALGIPYTTTETYSILPKNRTIALTYAGFATDDGFYMHPNVSVTLTVSGKKRANNSDTGTNRVYITFDDGPSVYTESILDTLGMFGVQATFFTLGKSVEKYPDTARRITNDGHLLASHGNTHDYDAIYQNADALLADVRAWQSIVQSIGALPEREDRYFRFPGGSVGNYFGAEQRQQMINGLHDMGYRIYDWNILTNDGVLFLRPDGMDSQTYWKKTFLDTWESCPYDTKILLMHDSIAETEELLPWLLQYIIDAGYTFGTLDMLDVEYYMK